MIHFLNGTLVGEDDLRISPRDLGFSRGYAVFDFFVTYGGKPFMMERHVARLFRSAEGIGLILPWTLAEVEGWVQQTLAANEGEPGEKGVRMMVSGGVARGLVPETTPTIIILVDPRRFPPPEAHEQGAAIVTVPHTRYCPELKTNHYIEAVKQEQLSGGVEPVYYDDQQVFEGAVSNIFAVIDGALLTPATNMLAGVTRDVLLECLKLDIPVRAQDFSIEDLRRADEVFLAGSSKEVLPITRIDGVPVGDGTVGPVTKEAMRQFKKCVASLSDAS